MFEVTWAGEECLELKYMSRSWQVNWKVFSASLMKNEEDEEESFPLGKGNKSREK